MLDLSIYCKKETLPFPKLPIIMMNKNSTDRDDMFPTMDGTCHFCCRQMLGVVLYSDDTR